MRDTGLVFVYGTLKVGGMFATHFDHLRISSKKGYIFGILYDFVDFPALVLPGEYKVQGEIHEYSDFDLALEMMDQIEGHPHLYKREVIEATTNDGEIVEALAYRIVNEQVLAIIKKNGDDLRVENGEWKWQTESWMV